MTTNLPVLFILITIFVLHTIFTHLFNWWWREADKKWRKDNESNAPGEVFIVNLIELIFFIWLIYYIT